MDGLLSDFSVRSMELEEIKEPLEKTENDEHESRCGRHPYIDGSYGFVGMLPAGI